MYLYRLPKWNWNYANYRDGLNKFTGGQIGIMLILEMAKIEITGGYIGFIVFIQITKMKLDLW